MRSEDMADSHFRVPICLADRHFRGRALASYPDEHGAATALETEHQVKAKH
jgi:hypothetical protein